MARKPRIHFPGACYHVILRGNGGQDIFFDDEDRHYLFQLIEEGVERYSHRVHCYCLMSNHIHMVIQVRDIPLSRIMQNVSFRYTRYIHSKTKQVGHLFQGRYKAILVDTDNYLLELVRYIHNNPVRISLVNSPHEYTWSSHNSYLDVTNTNKGTPWLTMDFVLKMFADDTVQAMKLYEDFINKGVKEKYREVFSKGISKNQILGENSFIEKAYELSSLKQTDSSTIKKIIQKVCREYKVTKKDLKSGSRSKHLAEARAMSALIVRETPHLTLTDLSEELQRDLSGLSQAASRLYSRSTKDVEIAKRLKKIMGELRKPISQA